MRLFTLPNAITSMNLLCGILGVICAIQGLPQTALLLMVLAAVFDFFDGMAARLINQARTAKGLQPNDGSIGKELDSLADMVSFGVLPALLLVFCMQHNGVTCWKSYLPLFLALMSALRLAKFNVDTRQTTEFLGLPTPAAALFCAALVNCEWSWLTGLFQTTWFLPAIAILLGLLLVSEIPMFSMKVAKGHKLLDAKRIVFFVLAVAALVYALAGPKDVILALLLVFTVYILENLILRVLPAKD